MNITESFLRGKIAGTITSSETVPFTKNVSKVPFLTKGYITVSPDSDSEEIFYYDGVTGTVGGVGTITITARGYNKTGTGVNTSNQKNHLLNAEFKGALNHLIINEKADLSNAKFTGEFRVPKYADATARDTLITSPDEGMIIYNIATGVNEQYISGAWNDVGNSGTPNASETVAGKIELSTDSELAAGTSVGTTGARLGISVDNTTTTQVLNKIPVLDTNGQINKFINSQSDGAASTTEKGLVELATDAEALAGVDESRYVNSKQMKDNYGQLSKVMQVSVNTTNAPVIVNHAKGLIPKSITVFCAESWSTYSMGAYSDGINACSWGASSDGTIAGTSASYCAYISDGQISARHHKYSIGTVTKDNFTINLSTSDTGGHTLTLIINY